MGSCIHGVAPGHCVSCMKQAWSGGRQVGLAGGSLEDLKTSPFIPPGYSWDGELGYKSGIEERDRIQELSNNRKISTFNPPFNNNDDDEWKLK